MKIHGMRYGNVVIVPLIIGMFFNTTSADFEFSKIYDTSSSLLQSINDAKKSVPHSNAVLGVAPALLVVAGATQWITPTKQMTYTRRGLQVLAAAGGIACMVRDAHALLSGTNNGVAVDRYCSMPWGLSLLYASYKFGQTEETTGSDAVLPEDGGSANKLPQTTVLTQNKVPSTQAVPGASHPSVAQGDGLGSSGDAALLNGQTQGENEKSKIDAVVHCVGANKNNLNVQDGDSEHNISKERAGQKGRGAGANPVGKQNNAHELNGVPSNLMIQGTDDNSKQAGAGFPNDGDFLSGNQDYNQLLQKIPRTPSTGRLKSLGAGHEEDPLLLMKSVVDDQKHRGEMRTMDRPKNSLLPLKISRGFDPSELPDLPPSPVGWPSALVSEQTQSLNNSSDINHTAENPEQSVDLRWTISQELIWNHREYNVLRWFDQNVNSIYIPTRKKNRTWNSFVPVSMTGRFDHYIKQRREGSLGSNRDQLLRLMMCLRTYIIEWQEKNSDKVAYDKVDYVVDQLDKKLGVLLPENNLQEVVVNTIDVSWFDQLYKTALKNINLAESEGGWLRDNRQENKAEKSLTHNSIFPNYTTENSNPTGNQIRDNEPTRMLRGRKREREVELEQESLEKTVSTLSPIIEEFLGTSQWRTPKDFYDEKLITILDELSTALTNYSNGSTHDLMNSIAFAIEGISLAYCPKSHQDLIPELCKKLKEVTFFTEDIFYVERALCDTVNFFKELKAYCIVKPQQVELFNFVNHYKQTVLAKNDSKLRLDDLAKKLFASLCSYHVSNSHNVSKAFLSLIESILELEEEDAFPKTNWALNPYHNQAIEQYCKIKECLSHASSNIDIVNLEKNLNNFDCESMLKEPNITDDFKKYIVAMKKVIKNQTYGSESDFIHSIIKDRDKFIQIYKKHEFLKELSCKLKKDDRFLSLCSDLVEIKAKLEDKKISTEEHLVILDNFLKRGFLPELISILEGNQSDRLNKEIEELERKITEDNDFVEVNPSVEPHVSSDSHNSAKGLATKSLLFSALLKEVGIARPLLFSDVLKNITQHASEKVSENNGGTVVPTTNPGPAAQPINEPTRVKGVSNPSVTEDLSVQTGYQLPAAVVTQGKNGMPDTRRRSLIRQAAVNPNRSKALKDAVVRDVLRELFGRKKKITPQEEARSQKHQQKEMEKLKNAVADLTR